MRDLKVWRGVGLPRAADLDSVTSGDQTADPNADSRIALGVAGSQQDNSCPD
jgi:hypothetical protein